MKIKIYADGANIKDMIEAYKSENISGFTTNPTLMKKSGVRDYLEFAKEVLKEIKNKPISFEVFSDEINEMREQAYILNDLADNVYVKIPVTNTKGIETYDLIKELTKNKVKVSVTAIFTIIKLKM